MKPLSQADIRVVLIPLLRHILCPKDKLEMSNRGLQLRGQVTLDDVIGFVETLTSELVSECPLAKSQEDSMCLTLAARLKHMLIMGNEQVEPLADKVREMDRLNPPAPETVNPFANQVLLK